LQRDPGGSVKLAFTTTVAVAAVLFAASMLGVAVAEAPTGTPPRTIAVQGVANLPIGQNDNVQAATAVYREAMAAAIGDGQSKASFLAGKVSASLGPVQTVVEEGGYISCRGGGEAGYAEYEGEQPDFGSAPRPGVVAGVATPLRAPAARPVQRVKRKKRRSPAAHKATAGSCTLTAQVSLVYTIT
jgi:predicted RecA/RadA family phage recombinase